MCTNKEVNCEEWLYVFYIHLGAMFSCEMSHVTISWVESGVDNLLKLICCDAFVRA